MLPFDIVRPVTTSEAAALLAEPGSHAIAGGTGIVDVMKLGAVAPRRLVDIRGLPLAQIEITSDRALIGALVTNTALAEHAGLRERAPAISAGLLSGASGQIRNAATVGGNLLQATRCPHFRAPDSRCNRRIPESGCAAQDDPASAHAVLGGDTRCIAVHPSDLAVVLSALGASVHLFGPAGERTLSLDDLYAGPPRDPVTLRPGELILGIDIPLTEAARTSRYLKLRQRASFEFAAASVAAALHLEAGRISAAGIALGGVAPAPWRSASAEALMIGARPSPDLWHAVAGRLLDGAATTPETAHKVPLARGAIISTLEELAAQ